MPKIKLGLFGGKRGDELIRYCKYGDAEVVAVCDKDEDVIEKLKKELKNGARYYYDFDEFIKDENVEAVILANCATEHAVFAIKSLHAGKHVFSEVLPCQCMKEAVELVEAVEHSGKIYAYGENYCYMPTLSEMRRLYKEGKLGELEYAEGEYLHNVEPIWANITYGERDHWRNFMYATFYCSHSLGPIIHVTGLRPESVVGFEVPYADRCARMGRRGAPAGVEMVTLENGAVVRSIHGCLDKFSVRYVFYGTKGRMENATEDSQNDGVSRIYTNFDAYDGECKNNPQTYLPQHNTGIEMIDKGAHGGGDYYVIHNFVKALKGEPADIIGVYEAMDIALPGLFAYFSILDGNKPQQLPDLRKKEERDKWRNDVRCADKAVAGDKVLPSYAKYDVQIPDKVYDSIRNKYLKNKQNDDENDN